jgi:hypothetical protein
MRVVDWQIRMGRLVAEMEIVQFLFVGMEKIDLCRRLMWRVVDPLLHNEI